MKKKVETFKVKDCQECINLSSLNGVLFCKTKAEKPTEHSKVLKPCVWGKVKRK